MRSELRTKVASTLAAAACVAGLAVTATPTSAAETLKLVSATPVTLPVAGNPNPVPRTAIDYTFETSALAPPSRTTVRVLFPRDYDPANGKRYPVLYLLHGGAADYRSWSATGGTVQVKTDGLDLITVMPDAGRSAWYTDWYNNGLGGPPKWETLHIGQLIPWIDANLPTIGNRSGRAIAGLSSGGFGAMSYASRHPDLFAAAAAFSGAVDTNTHPVVAGKVIDALALQDRGIPGSLWGIRETEEVRWRGHNPWDLATNLSNTVLALRTGNGEAGGDFGGGGFRDPGGFFLERATHDQTVSFHNRLEALKIGHVYDNYGPGTHSFPYWNRSLERTLPMFMDTFRASLPDPPKFSYRSIEQSYDIYGWNVDMHRGVVEFSKLDVRESGFTLSGSGSATVTSAPIFEPGRRYDVTIGGDPTSLVADDTGRLTFDVPLGPANLTQQYFTPTHESPATTVHTTEVEIATQDDTTPPQITIGSPSDGEEFVLGEDATASFSCTDDDSGVASCDGSDLDTSTVGDHVFTVNASDKAGNTTSKTHHYRVVYDTDAFARPVEPPPAMNESSRNRSIPFRWTLRDADGASYASLEADDVDFTWVPIDCGTREQVGAPVAASGDGPTYDVVAEQYTYTARGPEGSAGSCRRFTMTLDDGTAHTADFSFR